MPVSAEKRQTCQKQYRAHLDICCATLCAGLKQIHRWGSPQNPHLYRHIVPGPICNYSQVNSVTVWPEKQQVKGLSDMLIYYILSPLALPHGVWCQTNIHHLLATHKGVLKCVLSS